MQTIIRLSGVVAAALLAAGAVTAQPKLSSAERADPAVKQSITRVFYTYQQCMNDAMIQCRALHPDDLPARFQCISEWQDQICASLPGAP